MLFDGPMEEETITGMDLGDYKVVSHLASGSTGDFWLALCKGRKDSPIYVAKTMHARLGMDHPFLEEFWLRVVQATRLNHPNIVQIHDGGETNGVQYVVMEYVPGISLEQVLAKRPIPPLWFTLEVACKICAALQRAHSLEVKEFTEKMMIHRSLSPRKVMISSSGGTKVLGFGIAHMSSQILDIPSQVRMARFAYCSPEHMRGTSLDHLSDIYSVGVMLYEMLSGQVPFAANSVFHLMQRIAEGNPRPLSQQNPQVSEQLAAVVGRAMHRRASSRYLSAQELGAELQGILAGLSKRSASYELSQFLGELYPELPWCESVDNQEVGASPADKLQLDREWELAGTELGEGESK